MQRAG